MWRIDRTADYGAFTDAARGRVDLARIERQREDILRIIGSIHTGAVRAYDVIRMLSRDGRPTPLEDANAHYGRIAKSLHILRRPTSPATGARSRRRPTPRRAATQSRGRSPTGQLYQRYQDGMEDQIGAFGLVLHAVVLFNTRATAAAVTQLRADGFDVRDEDVASRRSSGTTSTCSAGIRSSSPARGPATASRPGRRQRRMTLSYGAT
jgi:TnpA family transposase